MGNRVAILANDTTYVFNLRAEIIKALIEEEYQVTVLCTLDRHIEKLENLGCKIIPVRYNRHGKNPIHDIKLFITYLEIIKRISPDIILTFNIKPNIYGGFVSRFCHIPYLTNITGLGTAVEYPGILQHLTIWLYRHALKNAERVFFQNAENQDFFNKMKIITDRGKLLPGSGVNLETYKVLPYPDDKSIHFVFISRIMKEKGIDEYLYAAKVIKQEYPNTFFHICGLCEEDYSTTIKEYQEKQIVIYHGQVDDIREILKDVHCTIHPSFYPEGISNVLLESCACGRPIITTDRSGCREVIEDKRNGYMIPQKDGKALAEAICQFIRLSYTEKKNMGVYARRKVEKEFDRRVVVAAYINTIQTIKSQKERKSD